MARCLASLRDDRAVAQVIVIDNASTDGSALEVRQHFPEVELIAWDENRGFAAAVNAGAAAARGEQLLLLNPDAELPPGTVSRMTDRRAALGASALGVRQVDAEGRFQLAVGPPPSLAAELGRKLIQWRLDRGDRRAGAAIDGWLCGPRSVPWVAGSCLLVRRDAFTAVGGFDDAFFLFFEDIDFCLRLGSVGHTVWYDPSITITHHRGQSTHHDPAAAEAAYRRSQLRFWRKHRGPLVAALIRAYLALRKGSGL